MVTLPEPREVTIATIRGRAWIYMALRRDKKASYFEYEIHEDPTHVPPKNLPLVARPIWLEIAELWAKMPEEARKEVLELRERKAKMIWPEEAS